jgi:hypothetical protein
MTDIYDRLTEPFPVEMERTVNKSGTSLTYLPIAEVTNRMNRVLGVGYWSSEILRCERDASDSDWVVAHVRVTANIGGNIVIHDGFGGQKIKRTRSTNDIVDLGDEFKGAVSDATKKALQQFGVGLYLARDVEAIEAEYAMEAAPTVQMEVSASTDIDPAVQDAYDRFMGLRNQLSEEDKPKLRSFWKSYSGDKPVPKNVTEWSLADLEAVIIESTRILLGGTLIVDADGGDELNQ